MSMLHDRKSDKKKGKSSGLKLVLAMLAAMLAMSVVVAATVLANRTPRHKTGSKTEIVSSEAQADSGEGESVDWESLADSESRTSDELNFWHMYDSDDDTKKTTVTPANTGEYTDDLVSETDLMGEKQEPAPSENEIEREGVGEESEQSISRNSVSGNLFDQNELSEGVADFVPVISAIKKNSYFDEGFRMNGEFKEYALNDVKTSFCGIDVSKYQGNIDWKAVADSGVDFAMIRMGSRGYSRGQILIDDKFYDNLRGCSENGIRVGIYFYSQAITPEEAIEEANYCVGSIGNFKVEYPIVFDSEEVIGDSYRTENLSPNEMSVIAEAFCNTVSIYGYTPMIAATKKQFASHFDLSSIEEYDWWLFDTDEISVFPYRYTIWQYSRTGNIEGIDGAVNLDISFIDYSGR